MKPEKKDLFALALMFLVVLVRSLWTMDSELASLAAYTPIGAMALFGGSYFRNTRGFVFPLATLWISDIILNRFVYFHKWVFFYEGFWWTYGAVALMVVTGMILLKKVKAVNFLLGALGVTFIHWIVTDLGVFMGSTMYPMTWAGWWQCLLAALPFERSFLLGTLCYGTIMFLAAQKAERYVSQFQNR